MFTKITGTTRQVIISSCLYLAQVNIGYTVFWAGAVIPKLRDLEQSPLPYLLTEAQLSLVASLINIGAVFGPYITLWLSNIRGRKPCIIGSGILLTIAYIILATSRNLTMLYIGRLLSGFACGTVGVIAMVYIGEIASTNIRGVLLTANGIFTMVGSLLLFCVGPFISYHNTIYLVMSLNIIFTIFAFYIPESPIYYMLQDKDKEMIKVLYDLDRTRDLDNLLTMKMEFVGTNTKREWIELFTAMNNRKSLFIVIFMNVFQQCSGILPIILFSTAIFEMAGSSIGPSLSMILLGCFQLSGCIVTPFFVERIGRKKILSLSCATCSLCMFLLGLYFYLDHISSSMINYIKWLPLVLLILFSISYCSGLAIIPSVLIGELFGSNVRSKGSTVTMTISWLFGFMSTTAFGALLKTVGGHIVFWFFSCTCAGGFLFTIFFVPETKGKTLMEIQDELK